MKDKDGGVYKHSVALTPKDHETAIYIDNNIYYVPELRTSKFIKEGFIASKPKIKDFCKFTNNRCLVTGFIVENFMGYSTQIPAIQTYLCEKEIKHKFDHTEQKIATKEELPLFDLTQMEYNIYYCLNHYFNYGTEDNSHSLFVYSSLKNKLQKDGTFRHMRAEVKHKVDINKILNLCNNKVKQKWYSLEKIDLEAFNSFNNDDKIAYYLYWSKDKGEYYNQFYDRFYGEYESFSEAQMLDITNKMKDLVQ